MGERASRRRSETPGEESRCGLSWTEAVQASATHRGCERPNASSRGALGSERLIAQDSPTRLLRTAVPGTRALCAPPEGGTSETRRSTGEALTWAHAARCSARSPRTSGRCPPPAWRSDTGTSRSATDSAPACHSFVSPNAPGIATKRSDNAFRQCVQTMRPDNASRCACANSRRRRLRAWTLPIRPLPRRAEVVKPTLSPRLVTLICTPRANMDGRRRITQRRIHRAYSWE
jgi:hypothetical protein